ncbi:hypothetical protein D931_02880 [Enterococcus faecium 13.SD.W.09]|nr:hypothetical protein D931_02880 [Enterococcus faecium 13.SD.W.09]
MKFKRNDEESLQRLFFYGRNYLMYLNMTAVFLFFLNMEIFSWFS